MREGRAREVLCFNIKVTLRKGLSHLEVSHRHLSLACALEMDKLDRPQRHVGSAGTRHANRSTAN